MPPNKKVKKQKQKQKQHQSVVVNVNTGRRQTRRKAPARRGGGGGGGGGNYVSYPQPIMMNTPDYAPIIHNLPAQYQNLPTITMPQRALENIPTPPQIEFPTPTTLQTATANVRPLGGAVSGGSVASSMTPVSIDTGPPKQYGLSQEALTRALGSLKKTPSSTPVGSRPSTPFEAGLSQEISRRSSRFFENNPMIPSAFSPIGSPLTLGEGVIRPAPRARPAKLAGLPEPLLEARNVVKKVEKSAYDKKRYEQKKMGAG